MARDAGTDGELMSTIGSMEALIRCASGGRTTFFDTAEFPWVEAIEGKWQAIRRELDARLQSFEDIPNFQDIQVEQAYLTTDNRWKTYILYAYGQRSPRNCAECPETASLVETIPGMTTAMFSILDGPKYIPSHRGPYNGVLRYHLGLKVPLGSCGIQVGPDIRHWEEGGSIIFDDTYSHSAWNETSDIRVVLFVDFLRPLPPVIDRLNREVVRRIGSSTFITDASRNLKLWNDKLDKECSAECLRN